MRYENPSYRRKQHRRLFLRQPKMIRLITGKLLYFVLCFFILRKAKLEYPLQVLSRSRCQASVLEAVAHAAGLHSPHQRVAPRSCQAGTTESR